MQIPLKTLNDNVQIPMLGFGTWKLPAEQVPDVLGCAIDAGYRHFDTAHAYLNEQPVGEYLRTCGVPRDDIFVTSKLWNNLHGYDSALKAFDATMDRLGMDVLDMYLIHWPVPMEDKYVDSWKAMIQLQKDGRIRSIGVSNFEKDHLQRLIDETGVAPSVNQIELHPRFQQLDARDHHDRLGVAIESWSPLGQGNMMKNDVLVRIGEKHDKSAAQIMLRWHLDQDLIVIPRSKTPANIRANLDVLDFKLDTEDMAAIAALDEGADGRIGPKPQELGAVDLPKTV